MQDIIKTDLITGEQTTVQVQDTIINLDVIAKEIRTERDKLLLETDWTQLSDSPLSETQKEAYRIYRQALRDITKQEGFPLDVIFPEIINF